MADEQIFKDQFETMKDTVLPVVDKAGRYFLLVNLLLYFIGCVVGQHLLGPVSYIAFLDHVCHWKVS